MPKRIQLRRTKGWRKPEGAVVVSRPSRFGNPYEIGETVRLDYSPYARLYAVEVTIDRPLAVALFRAFLRARPEAVHHRDIGELVGKDLACWCPLDEPCHADVLLEIANGEPA